MAEIPMARITYATHPNIVKAFAAIDADSGVTPCDVYEVPTKYESELAEFEGPLSCLNVSRIPVQLADFIAERTGTSCDSDSEFDLMCSGEGSQQDALLDFKPYLRPVHEFLNRYFDAWEE